MKTIEEKLTFITQRLNDLAPLASSPNRTLREFSNQIFLYLQVWKNLNLTKDSKEYDDSFFYKIIDDLQKRSKNDNLLKSEKMKIDGPLLWEEWHKRALLNNNIEDITAEQKWIIDFSTKLPCGECRVNFMKHFKELPPRYNDYFNWTVDFHNLVNKSLGKEEFTYQSALDKWK